MEHLIGRFIRQPHMGQKNRRRDALVVDVSLAPVGNPPDGERLSITGTVWPGPYPATCRKGPDESGQIIETVASILDVEEGGRARLYGGFVYAGRWDRARVAKLVAIWRLYHMNDMRAGCVHQRALGWDHREQDERVGVECPICGYVYGSSWLYEPLPPEVIAFVESLEEARVA